MFESINRLPQIYRYYEHFHKSLLSKSWHELTERGDNSLSKSLALFYDTVVSTFHSQVSLNYLNFLPILSKQLCLLRVKQLSQNVYYL